ncbi:hypothetical protein [Nonomuraea sp. LPB2021202275-12-8]|uniref:hypothetical protein n=1 Tax=Nonomuraea sp. LPB2021202275-12-8 TaxID=3120159 RepID=UPI00300CBE6A
MIDPLVYGDPAAYVPDDELPADDELSIPCRPGCGAAQGEPCRQPCPTLAREAADPQASAPVKEQGNHPTTPERETP